MKSFISTLTIFLNLAMVSFTNQASNLDNVIDALKDLVIVGISRPKRIHNCVTRDPRPVSGYHLRTRVLIREPRLCNLQGWVIHKNAVAGTDEVHPTKGMVRIEVVIDFAESGVDLIFAG